MENRKENMHFYIMALKRVNQGLTVLKIHGVSSSGTHLQANMKRNLIPPWGHLPPIACPLNLA